MSGPDWLLFLKEADWRDARVDYAIIDWDDAGYPVLSEDWPAHDRFEVQVRVDDALLTLTADILKSLWRDSGQRRPPPLRRLTSSAGLAEWWAAKGRRDEGMALARCMNQIDDIKLACDKRVAEIRRVSRRSEALPRERGRKAEPRYVIVDDRDKNKVYARYDNPRGDSMPVDYGRGRRKGSRPNKEDSRLRQVHDLIERKFREGHPYLSYKDVEVCVLGRSLPRMDGKTKDHIRHILNRFNRAWEAVIHKGEGSPLFPDPNSDYSREIKVKAFWIIQPDNRNPEKLTWD
jgi:hypothetical protein